jgi:hypothetical protein
MSNPVPTIEELARRYLEHRRQFGYRLFSQSYGLLAFARFVDQTAPGQPITVALALRWATRQPALPITVASRLSIIRGFAGFCATFDPRTETVPARLTNQAPRRRAPHIYSREQLRLILRRTDSLRPWRTNLRSITLSLPQSMSLHGQVGAITYSSHCSIIQAPEFRRRFNSRRRTSNTA